MAGFYLEQLTSVSHPLGNRIDLQWRNPDPTEYPGTILTRKRLTHPVTPTDGQQVRIINALLFIVDSSIISDLDMGIISSALYAKFEGKDILLTNRVKLEVLIQGMKWYVSDQESSFIVFNKSGALSVYTDDLIIIEDLDLKSETFYYYTLFPFKNNPLDYLFEPRNRISAMATGPYNFAGQMYDLLPRIYHRYDTTLIKGDSPGFLDEDKEKGQLRRFLDIPGSQFDLLYSFAKTMLNLYNVHGVDGNVLPLLAEWIGWNTNFTLELSGQRNEIRNAPSIYKTTGIIPTVEATVKRVSGWKSQTKEFVHNVFVSNRPERLNLWEVIRSEDGTWPLREQPLSLNFANDGRPSSVVDEGKGWLFFHTPRKNRWDIWYKTFEENTETEKTEWTPSRPFAENPDISKYPSVAVQNDMVWVFWSSFDDALNKWSIKYKRRDGEDWSSVKYLCSSWFEDNEECDTLDSTEPDRKFSCIVTDGSNGLWLFWLERNSRHWRLKYNLYDGTDWVLPEPKIFPVDGTTQPDVHTLPFVLFNANDAARPLWVFWARKEKFATGTYWRIAFRFKGSLDPENEGDWSAVQLFPNDPPDAAFDDLEPAVFANSAGEIELFWSSSRGRSRSIWYSRLLNVGTNEWQDPERITSGPYSQGDPLPIVTGDTLRLIYRSNQSLTYPGETYHATLTTDFRYAGSTALDTRNTDKLAISRLYDDFQTYSYDTRRPGEITEDSENGVSSAETELEDPVDQEDEQKREARYARDRIGVFLSRGIEDEVTLLRKRSIVRSEIKKFLPIQVRPVFLDVQPTDTELIYTYDFPQIEPRQLIGEQMIDTILSEVYGDLSDEHVDTVSFKWIKTWEAGLVSGLLPDLSVDPPDLSFRLFLKGVEEGE